jgi:DNA-binding NarL/FixJ family response regulator
VTITVVIADDQELVRAGFAAILSRDSDFDVLAECADGLEAVEAVNRLHPDVVLLDIHMPRLDGLAATRLITEAGGPTRIVIVTTFDTDEYVRTAISYGASGFLLKDAGPTLLKEAIRAASTGDALISPAIMIRLLKDLGRSSSRESSRMIEQLTDRELEVVQSLARGRTNTEIAGELFISLSTVKSHLGHIQSKIRARNRVEIASWAWESGLMSESSTS